MMSLHFEKLENKIALSSFGYYKPNLHKPNLHKTEQHSAVVKTHNSPVFVCSIMPDGRIHCAAAKFNQARPIN